MNFTTEQVIQEVEAHPTLWDVAHEDYKNRVERLGAWTDIARVIFENFEGMRKETKQEAIKKLSDRWRTARDTYRKIRNTKSFSNKLGRRLYKYFDMLTFLEKNNRFKPLETSFQLTEETSADDENLTTSEVPVSSQTVVLKKRKADTGFEIKVEPEPDLDSSESDNDPLNLLEVIESKAPTRQYISIEPQNKLKKYSVEEYSNNFIACSANTETAATSTTQSVENDEDFAFFASIMPTVKKLTSYQKLLFRSKVLQHLLEIEKDKIETKKKQ